MTTDSAHRAQDQTLLMKRTLAVCLSVWADQVMTPERVTDDTDRDQVMTPKRVTDGTDRDQVGGRPDVLWEQGAMICQARRKHADCLMVLMMSKCTNTILVVA